MPNRVAVVNPVLEGCGGCLWQLRECDRSFKCIADCVRAARQAV